VFDAASLLALSSFGRFQFCSRSDPLREVRDIRIDITTGRSAKPRPADQTCQIGDAIFSYDQSAVAVANVGLLTDGAYHAFVEIILNFHHASAQTIAAT
jgi:hypothetical protein